MQKHTQANYYIYRVGKWVYLRLLMYRIGTESHGVSVGYHCVVSVCVLVPLATLQCK